MVILRTLRTAALVFLATASLAWADVSGTSGPLTVGSAEELARALESTRGGVIRLAGGKYGSVSIRGLSARAGEPLVIKSANPGDRAIISGLDVQDSSGLVFRDIAFDYSFAPTDAPHIRPFQIARSGDVAIENSLFDGDLASGVSPSSDGFPTGFGIYVGDSAGVVLAGNEIRNFYRGIVVGRSSRVEVTGNELHTIRMDGMNFSEVSDVLIARNNIHDFARSLNSEDHADMIQFWTTGTQKPSSRIVIRENILNSGDGWFTQSIFMRNELVDLGAAGSEMFYRDVSIEGNLIINAHIHGITVGETDGLTITRNTLVRNRKSEGRENNPGLWTPQIRIAPSSRSVRVDRNVVSAISGSEAQADWNLHDNIFIQDRSPTQPNHYLRVFSDTALTEPEKAVSYLPRRSGPLAGTGVGSPLLSGSALQGVGGSDMKAN